MLLRKTAAGALSLSFSVRRAIALGSTTRYASTTSTVRAQDDGKTPKKGAAVGKGRWDGLGQVEGRDAPVEESYKDPTGRLDVHRTVGSEVLDPPTHERHRARSLGANREAQFDSTVQESYGGEMKHSTFNFATRDERNKGLNFFSGSDALGFTMEPTRRVQGPVVAFPRHLAAWNISSVSDLIDESLDFDIDRPSDPLTLFFVLDPSPDVAVIGLGHLDRSFGLRHREKIEKIRARFRRHRIPVEILPTDTALRVFNACNEDGRFVVGAFLPRFVRDMPRVNPRGDGDGDGRPERVEAIMAEKKAFAEFVEYTGKDIEEIYKETEAETQSYRVPATTIFSSKKKPKETATESDDHDEKDGIKK